MKKILKILGIVILVFIIALISLPYLFRGQIFDLIQEEANKNLNAKVSIGDLDLSLFENFPDFTVTISNIQVDNKAPFVGTTLAKIGEIKASVDLMSVINGSSYGINTIGLSDVNAHVIVLPNGTANYDIALASEESAEEEEEIANEEETAETEESSPFNVQIKEYYMRNVNVIYDDQQGDMYAETKNLSHEGKGDFTLDNFLFETKTTADAITYKMDGVAYLNEVNTEIDFDFQAEMEAMKFTFMENVVRLNNLTLGFDGWVAMPSDPIDMDITFETKETSFKNILSLVPAVYQKDFADVTTTGSLALNGAAKGRYQDLGNDEMEVPGFNLALLVKDAMFQYPDMPKNANNIQIDLKVENPGKDLDLTVVDLKKFHVEMAGNPIDAMLHVKTPMSDPDIAGAVKAAIDLESIADVIPMEEGESYKGNITSDIEFAGRMSAIDEERYEDFKAQGKLIVLGIDYKSPELPYAVQLEKMYMDFSPKYVELSQFDAKVGKSDFSAKGRIDNMLAYYFRDEPLTGSFNLSSNLIDVNELMGPEAEEEEEAEGAEDTAQDSTAAVADTTNAEVVEIPGNINFVLTSNIKQLIYDNIEITNFNGKVTLADSAVNLDKVAMNLMDGSLVMSGMYSTKDVQSPAIDFDFAIQQFDVQKTVVTFNTIEKMAPVLKSSYGKFSTDLVMTGRMDNRMEMIMNSLNGNGSLTTHNVKVENDVLEKIDGALKSNKYNPLTLNDVNISYEFKDGKITTEPFDVKLADSKATIYGYSTFEQTMDYTMDVEVPVSQFGGAAQGAINNLLSQAQDAGINTDGIGDKLKVKVKIEGDIADPSVKPVFEGTQANSAKDAVKDAVKDKVDEAKKEAKKKAKEEADKLLEDAQKQADNLVVEAKKQADNIRKEGKKAGDQLRAEAKKQAQSLVDEASNPIAKKLAETAAKKVEEEADKKATQLEQEANKRADGVETKAQEQADKIMEQARQKADEKLAE